jgi:mono/diheme cytochrome c family protein
MQMRKMKRALSRASVRGPAMAVVTIMPASVLMCAAFMVSSAAAADATGGKAKHGEALFKERCISCHNKQPGDTSPFGPPNLNGIFRKPARITTKEAASIITNGKSPMPGFGTVLSPGDIDDLIAYLKTK